MSKKTALTRYALIINRLKKHPHSFQEIQDYLDDYSELQDQDYRISKRTFNRDINDIRELYKLDISYNPALRKFEIEDNQNEEINNRMLDAFQVFSAFQLGEGLQQYIHFQKRKPQGTDYFNLILHAVKNGLMVKFQYQKFREEEESVRLAALLGLKEYNERWYMLAKEQIDEKIKLFALDRIKDMEVTKKRSSYPENFQLDDYFRYSFGIIHHEGVPSEPIILSFTPEQADYIKSLPLHHSQTVVLDNDEVYTVSLNVHPTYDLVKELMSHGSAVQVLSPQSLAEQLSKLHKEAAFSNKKMVK